MPNRTIPGVGGNPAQSGNNNNTPPASGSVPAGGDLAGTYPDPTVVALHSGATRLPLGAIADGEFFKRVGGNVVGAAGAPPVGVAAGDLGGSFPSPTVLALHETSGPTKMVLGAVADGSLLRRVGGALVGARPPIIKVMTNHSPPGGVGVDAGPALLNTLPAGDYAYRYSLTYRCDSVGVTQLLYLNFVGDVSIIKGGSYIVTSDGGKYSAQTLHGTGAGPTSILAGAFTAVNTFAIAEIFGSCRLAGPTDISVSMHWNAGPGGQILQGSSSIFYPDVEYV